MANTSWIASPARSWLARRHGRFCLERKKKRFGTCCCGARTISKSETPIETSHTGTDPRVYTSPVCARLTCPVGSHIHNGRYEVLDHILVSQEFVRTNPDHIGYVQYLQMFNDHVVDETFTEEKRDNIKSDHGKTIAICLIVTHLTWSRSNRGFD